MISNKDFHRFFRSRTAKLAATYLGVIMLMSISFSFVFYYTSARQPLHQPAPPIEQFRPDDSDVLDFDDNVQGYIADRFREARETLVIRLIWLNVGIFLLGSALSYMLARISLRPIEESMESQSRFISDASHELRTPLAVLQTTNEVALRKKQIKESEARDIIAHNIVEVEKLKSLSNSLLELLKSDGQTLARDSVNLQTVVDEAITNIKDVAKTKQIKIKHEKVDMVNINSNSDLLVRLLTILLDNAVKYSSNKTTVRINVQDASDKVILSVEDQGIGMEPSQLQHIFKRFYRADQSRSSQHTDGYGLGLSIAEKIAQQLQITIDVKSEVGKGSEFILAINK